MPTVEELVSDLRTNFKEAAAGKFGPAFREGELIDGVANEEQIQFFWEPNAVGGLLAVEFDFYLGEDPVSSFEQVKKESLERKGWRQEDKQIDGWKDWPRGFPNQNKYEDVSHCGATLDERKVVWVQGKVLVMILCISDMGAKLKEYADGVWNVVHNVFGQ